MMKIHNMLDSFDFPLIRMAMLMSHFSVKHYTEQLKAILNNIYIRGHKSAVKNIHSFSDVFASEDF